MLNNAKVKNKLACA